MIGQQERQFLILDGRSVIVDVQYRFKYLTYLLFYEGFRGTPIKGLSAETSGHL
jgi:hypothetical protein